jgi:hypothetical protein
MNSSATATIRRATSTRSRARCNWLRGGGRHDPHRALLRPALRHQEPGGSRPLLRRRHRPGHRVGCGGGGYLGRRHRPWPRLARPGRRTAGRAGAATGRPLPGADAARDVLARAAGHPGDLPAAGRTASGACGHRIAQVALTAQASGSLRRVGASMGCRPVLVPCFLHPHGEQGGGGRNGRCGGSRPGRGRAPGPCCAATRRPIARPVGRACPPSACRTARCSAA